MNIRSHEFVTGAVVGMSLSAAMIVGSEAIAPPLPTDHEPYAASCYDPTASELLTVNDLFTEPSIIPNRDYAKGGGSEHRDRVTAKIAKKYDLTLFDSDTYSKTLEYASLAHDASYYLDNANKLLAAADISITVAKPGEADLRDNQVPTKADLETKIARIDIENIGEGVLGMPVQYFSLTGLKHIILAKNIGDAGAYAITGGSDDTVVVSIDSLNDVQTIDHEAMHLLDDRECNRSAEAANDTAFKALNNGKNIYTKKKPAGITSSQEVELQEQQVFEDDAKHDAAAVCHDQAVLNDLLPDVYTTSAYGRTSVAEDKAEIAAAASYPSAFGVLLDPHTPVIRNKFEFLMARLYHFNPRIVRYLAAVGTRPSKSYSDYDMLEKNC